MKYDHNQICTTDKIVEIGGVYQYKEDSHVSEVEVVEDKSDENGVGFKLRVRRHIHGLEIPVGEEFNVWAASGKYAYGGMWRLYPDGEYVNREMIDEALAKRPA